MKLSVLIATKNRQINIIKLLNSITESFYTPHEIVIVSSGENITAAVELFQDQLNIVHEHVEIESQVHQKKIGLSKLSKDSDWVMFCDDDMEFSPETFSQIFKSFINLDPKILGIGINLRSDLNKVSKSNSIRKILFKPGHINKWGVTNSYSKVEERIETSWLNGISLWRISIVKLYNPELSNFIYAAYEDVFFSYKVRKIGKLVYEPNIKINLQNLQNQDMDTIKNFIALTVNRIAFVRQNKEFSILGLYIYELSRLLKVVLSKSRGKKEKSRFLLKVLCNFKNFQELDNQMVEKFDKPS